MNETNRIHVSNEVGTLRRLLVHSPDSGLGKVVPSKAQDWLFEDIVHLDTMRREEYDYYLKVLLYFLDPDKVKGKLAAIDADLNRSFFKPEHPNFHHSDKVIEVQKLLAEFLENKEIHDQLIASVCAIEHCTMEVQQTLLDLPSIELAKTLISGTLPNGKMIFPPVPNLIFTRDIGITINNSVLLNKPAKQARTREALLAKYIFFYHPIFAKIRENIIEIPENEHHFLMPDEEKESARTTLEGGDVMMIAPNHLLIGVSERTTAQAAKQVIEALFARNVLDKVTVVKIPKKRDYMHIDTVFTQVKRNMWVLLGSIARNDFNSDAVLDSLSDKNNNAETVKIVQFRKGEELPEIIEHLEDLLRQISMEDFGCRRDEVQFIYSGNREFPYGAREQWTDSCNLLALKEGVVIGYDRNDKTLEAFRRHGFRTVKAKDVLEEFEHGLNPHDLTDTFIMLPSAELSRARGGSHCMSMPILRDFL
ncbi:MAG: arginine deiminase family protein [Spirosomataceae bacterium]